jgi:hypothetical protein
MSSGVGRYRSVGIAICYGLHGPGIESRGGGKTFPQPSGPALGPTQPPVNGILFTFLCAYTVCTERDLLQMQGALLYGCETWSLALRKERRLRVFENRVLRRIFGPKTIEVTSKWRKLHNDEINDLYSAPNIFRLTKSRSMSLAGNVARMGEEWRCIQGFGGET